MPERRGFVIGYLPRGGVGVELGVWQGDFSERLLRRARPRVLHLVDPWRFIPTGGYAEAWYGGALAHDQADMDAIHASVVRRFAGRPEVHVHRETSLEAARALEPVTLDWVYVDGDHTHDAVIADLRTYFPLLRSDGLSPATTMACAVGGTTA